MEDEKFVFISDVSEKKNIARSSRNRRTHNGKGGRVLFPSDYLSKKELQKMNGEVKTYRLNEPMSWAEFRAMPDNIKIAYVNLLRQKFDVSDTQLGKMFGTTKDGVSLLFKRLGINSGKAKKHRNFNNEKWIAWCNGIPVQTVKPEEEPEEVSVQEELEEVPVREEPEVLPEEMYDPTEAVSEEPEEVYDLPILKAGNAKLCAEIRMMKSMMQDIIREKELLEAKLEVVYLIFGNRG